MIKRKARKELGATKAGDLIFTFPSVSENTHLMISADNSVTGLSTTALGAEVLGSTMSDIIPAIGGVYDIGATGFEWYDGFFSNSVNIDGGVIQGAAGAIAVNDVLIVDNVLSQLSTPLYGNREIISEGGFTIASTDPAYLRLSQLPTPVQPDPISVDGSSMPYYELYYYEDYSYTGYTRFKWTESYGPDVSSLVPGNIYTVTWRDSYYTLYTANLEFVTTSQSMGSRTVDFVSLNPGSGSGYYIYQGPDCIVITGLPVDDYTTVLSTYGSEGMIRFHPVTKEFEGHDGTAWQSLNLGTPTVRVAGTNIISCFAGNGSISGNGGSNNVFLGCCSGAVAGCYAVSNIFIGCQAGACTDTGKLNNFLGFRAGRCNTSGSYNNFFGHLAGYYHCFGGNNNFFGDRAGYGNYCGSHNNFFGAFTGYCNTTGSHNNFFGRYAGRENITGSSNNFFGYGAGFDNDSGCFNNILGFCAGFYTTTGCDNNFLGRYAGYCNTTGSSNNFFGSNAGLLNTVGNSNNFFGAFAGRSNTIGIENNFLGRSAGYCNTEGSYNDFFGQCAGRNNTTGSYNTFIGYRAGRCNTTGSNNLLFGCTSGVGAGGLANITTECNRIIMGNTSHTCAQIQVAWTVPSDVRDKCIFGAVPHGRGFLENVTPIEYAFKNRETNEITDPPGKRRYGFSAQEILALEGNDPVIVGNDNPEKFSLTTDYIIPILVNGFKELNAEVKQLRAEIELLKKST